MKRAMLRCVSEYQFAILNPKVMGSAWMPWVRPIMGVSLNSQARRSSTSARRSQILAITCDACWMSSACAVSTTSLEVRP